MPKYIAKVCLNFDKGRLRVEPGQVIILDKKDEKAGINIGLLLKHGGIEPFKSRKQVEAIKDKYLKIDKPRRDALRADNMRAGRGG